MNTHTLVLLIKIYSTDISTQKDANTLSICLIGFTYSPIHQSRHNFVFFRNYCTGGTLKETGVGAQKPNKYDKTPVICKKCSTDGKAEIIALKQKRVPFVSQDLVDHKGPKLVLNIGIMRKPIPHVEGQK
jgi:hypothetical protein